MITDKDIQKIITKLIPVMIPIFATKEDLKMYATKAELAELRNDVNTKMDQVYGEVKSVREEMAAMNALYQKADFDITELKCLPTNAKELKQLHH